ncbi:hypothetical protein D3C87_1338630 [compost metagenome]
MADLVLVGRTQFGAGHITLRHPEQRVITETVLAAGSAQYPSVPQAFAENRQRIVSVTHQRQHANELRTALGFRYIFQCIEQFGIVRRIALAVGIARRIDAWRTAKEIHRQTGIVGQRRQPGNACGVACLEDRVLDERQTGFFRLDLAPLANRAQLHRFAEHGLEFFEFAGVMAGQYELLDVHHSPGKSSWLKLMVLILSPFCTLISKVRVSC